MSQHILSARVANHLLKAFRTYPPRDFGRLLLGHFPPGHFPPEIIFPRRHSKEQGINLRGGSAMTLGHGKRVTLGHGKRVTLSHGKRVTLGHGKRVTLGHGKRVTLGHRLAKIGLVG